MKNITTHSRLCLLVLLAAMSQQVSAGTIYRFTDENGGIVMSKSLPPYAAQQGYDILNDKSLRLIKHVAPALTPEQIAEKERQLAEQQEAKRLAEIAAKQQQEQRRQQAIADQTLLASFQTEQDLLNARETDIGYRQTELDKALKHLDESKAKLNHLQQQAAEQELSGRPISVNMSKHLEATQQEINNDQINIERLTLEIEQLNKQYDHDQVRLKQLLSKDNN